MIRLDERMIQTIFEMMRVVNQEGIGPDAQDCLYLLKPIREAFPQVSAPWAYLYNDLEDITEWSQEHDLQT